MEYTKYANKLNDLIIDGISIAKLSIASELQDELPFMELDKDKENEIANKLFEIAYNVYLKFEDVNEYKAVCASIDYYYDNGDLDNYCTRDLERYI